MTIVAIRSPSSNGRDNTVFDSTVRFRGELNPNPVSQWSPMIVNSNANKTQSSRSKSIRRWPVRFASVAVRCAVSAVLICGSLAVVVAMGESRRPTPQDAIEQAIPVVETARVEGHDGGIDVKIDGVVIPFRELDVAAEVTGRVVFKSENCRIGRTVQKGDLLLRIDPSDFRLDVLRLEQELIQATTNERELKVDIAARQRQIELANEDLKIKSREVARYESMGKSGAYSETELDSARLKVLQSRDSLQTEHDQLELLETRAERMKAAVQLASAQLEKAKLDLSRTEIFAPIGGVVTQAVTEVGGFIQRGGSLVRLQDTSQMEIRCSLRMREISWILNSTAKEAGSVPSGHSYQMPETPATVSFDVGDTTYQWKGCLSYFDGGSVDRQTRMIPCRVYVRQPQAVEVTNGHDSSRPSAGSIALMSGMFVNVTVHTQPSLNLVKVPEAAIQPGNSVWRVERSMQGDHGDQGARRNHGGPSGRLQQVPVRVAQSMGDSVLVYSDMGGLKPWDDVVVSPLAAPVDGGAVTVMVSP